jgi:FkbM family methyltransferase
MNNFFKEIINKSFKSNPSIESLKNDGRPIVIYGAGKFAFLVERFLNSYGLCVDAFFVDDEYVNCNTNFKKAVFTLSEVADLFGKFSVVIGNTAALKDINEKVNIKRYNNQIIGIYQFDCFFLDEFSQFNYKYLKLHAAEFEAVYSYLNDETSKKAYTGFINTKLTHNSKYLGTYHNDQYFCEDIVKISENEIFVDGGAFTGDTLIPFIEKSRGKFSKYYAFEPDVQNASSLKSLISKIGISGIEFMQKGLWNKSDVLKFSGNGTDGSLINDDGKTEIIVDSIDNLCKDATFIKMDIEGAEFEALKGAPKR